MASIPTLKELYDGIRQQLETELNITIPVFGKVVLNALAAVQAGKLKLYWLAIAEVKKNIFVDTADTELIGGTLERFGRVKLGRNRFAATQGFYTITLVGTIGAQVPAGTIFKSDDTSSNPGKLYIVDTGKALAAENDTITIRALTAGTDGRLTVGDTLTATSPLLNVNDQEEVVSEDIIPLEAEGIEEYRSAIIRAFQLESQGGAATDYRIWSADAQGVRFVYPYASSGSNGEIDLYIEANQSDSTDGKGTPTAQILSDVEDVVEFDPDNTKPLNERGRRPLGVTVNYLPVSPQDVVINISNAINFDASTQSAILTSLTQEIDDIRPFVDAADILDNKNDILDENRIISIIQALLSGDQKFDGISITVDGNPVVNSITFEDGDIPFLTNVNYV